jgi:hypothetical protein
MTREQVKEAADRSWGFGALPAQPPAELPRALVPDGPGLDPPAAADATGALVDDDRDCATAVPMLRCEWCPAAGGFCCVCGAGAGPGGDDVCECGHARKHHVGQAGACVAVGMACPCLDFVTEGE